MRNATDRIHSYLSLIRNQSFLRTPVKSQQKAKDMMSWIRWTRTFKGRIILRNSAALDILSSENSPIPIKLLLLIILAGVAINIPNVKYFNNKLHKERMGWTTFTNICSVFSRCPCGGCTRSYVYVDVQSPDRCIRTNDSC